MMKRMLGGGDDGWAPAADDSGTPDRRRSRNGTRTNRDVVSECMIRDAAAFGLGSSEPR